MNYVHSVKEKTKELFSVDVLLLCTCVNIFRYITIQKNNNINGNYNVQGNNYKN